MPQDPVSIAVAESAALAGLYERYRRELVAFVRMKVGGGPPEPEDVAQQAFVNYAALDDPTAVHNPRAFLYRTAANIVTNHHRRAALDRKHAALETEQESDRARDELSPEIVLLDREQLALVEAAIKGLPARRRRYLLLNRLDGLSYVEIARREGLSEGVVRKQVAKAIRAIDAVLKAAEAGRTKPNAGMR